MKTYTDIEQSMKLAEFLKHETADMYYFKNKEGEFVKFPEFVKKYKSMADKQIVFNDEFIPCWSLDALMDILPANIVTSSNVANTLHVTYHMDMYKREDHKWIINYERERMYTFGLSLFHTFNVDFVKDLGSVELIDTAYNTIITLHNNKIL